MKITSSLYFINLNNSISLDENLDKTVKTLYNKKGEFSVLKEPYQHSNEETRGIKMGTVIIFGLISILAVFATISSIRKGNILAFLIAAPTALVFGFFSIMTILKNGFPDVS